MATYYTVNQWKKMPVKTWNVRDLKTGEQFQVQEKTKAEVLYILAKRWMLSHNETSLRAVISLARNQG